MADYYENLAADYDWLFDDDALASGLAIDHPATGRLLEQTSHASAVLDAACGTGLSAAALAHRGYRVWAADGSDAMVEMAAARFRREHLEIPLVRCMWAEPPAAVLDQEHVAHLVFIFEDGGRIEPREHRIVFHPFTLGELRERLDVAGLREVDTDFDDGRDRYAVTAVPAGDPAQRSWPRSVS